MADTLILGVGNPLLGDDALGVRVVQELQARPDLPPGLDVIDGGTDGIGLIPVLERYQRVIVVDAVLMDLPPGTLRRFTWNDVRAVSIAGQLSLHQSDLTEALRLAEVLNCLPADLIIYGVQPQNLEWDQPMSPAVEETIPLLIEHLLQEFSHG